MPGQGAALARRQHDKLQVWVALGAADVASCSAGFLRWDWEQAVDGAWGAECAHCVEEQTSLAFQGELKFRWCPSGSHPCGQARLCEHFQKALSEGSDDAFETLFFPDPLLLGF